MRTQATDLTVRKTITVEAPVERAFATFTDRIGSWWPLGDYSVSRERAETAIMEGRPGGRIYERTTDGEEAEWGEVLVWEPPRRIVFSWRPSVSSRPPTEVEVRFSGTEHGATRVDLEHRGWERLGEQAAEAHSGYDQGWTKVLGRYSDAARG